MVRATIKVGFAAKTRMKFSQNPHRFRNHYCVPKGIYNKVMHAGAWVRARTGACVGSARAAKSATNAL